MDKTDAFAFVYKIRRGWTYDTDDSGALRHGPVFPTWREAFDEAHKAAFMLRFRPLQKRVNEIVKALASVYPTHRHTMGLPPEPKTWEGDDA